MAIFHIWSQYPPRGRDAARRLALAQSSWARQLWTERPVCDAELPRLFSCGGKKFPYVRDIFNVGGLAAKPDDILVYTNADIGMATNAAVRIAFALQSNDAGYAFRRDWPKLERPPHDDTIRDGVHYCGKDCFFFRKRWWTTVGKDMPDMLVGREAWDAVLCELIEATNPNKPLSVPDLIWHERHGGDDYWEKPYNRYTLPGQRHNLRMAKVWMLRHGINPQKHGIV